MSEAKKMIPIVHCPRCGAVIPARKTRQIGPAQFAIVCRDCHGSSVVHMGPIYHQMQEAVTP